MSQNILTNTTTPPLAGSTAVGVINLAADSLARWFCGAATPTAAAAGLTDLRGFVWHDTATNTLKVRNQADTAWITVGSFNETSGVFSAAVQPAAVTAADTGAANAYAVAPAPAWPAYASGGPFVAFVGAHANTGASTLNVNGLGVKPLVRVDGSPLQPGDIPGTGAISVACANPSGSGFVLLTQKATPTAFVKGTVSNLVAGAAGGTASASISADRAVLFDANDNPYLAAAVSQSASLGASGAGGLDTGTAAANSLYSLWLIYNPAGATLSALLSLSATAPVLPSGYAFTLRVGWVLTDGAANVMAYVQRGRRFQFKGVGAGEGVRLGYGNTGGAWTAITVLGVYAPTTAAVLHGAAYKSGNNITQVAANGSFAVGYSATNVAPFLAAANAGTSLGYPWSIVPETSALYWLSGDAGSSAWLNGWEDNL